MKPRDIARKLYKEDSMALFNEVVEQIFDYSSLDDVKVKTSTIGRVLKHDGVKRIVDIIGAIIGLIIF